MQVHIPLYERPAAAIRARLGLLLSAARIEALMAVYRAEKREPSEQELRTLDTLLYDHIMRPHISPMTALATEDADTAAILADLIEKSKDVRGIAPMPTPTAALGVATAALARADIYPPPPQGTAGERLLLISNDNYPLLPRRALRPVEYTALSGAPWRVVRAVNDEDHMLHPAVKGDLCSLIPIPEREDALGHLLAFFSRQDIQKSIRRLRAVCRGTYLETLLSWANGYDIDFSALPGLAEQPPDKAVTRLPHGYLMCADQTSTRYIMEQAQACGLTVAAFARVTDTFTLSFSTHGLQDFAFSMPQLRHLTRPRLIELRTASCSALHKGDTLTEIHRLGQDTLVCCTLPLRPTLVPQEVLRAFESALDALNEAGGDQKTAYAAIGICENSTTQPSGLWAAILGIHRALCEYNIPSLAPMFAASDAVDGTLTLCLIARTLPICDSAPSETITTPCRDNGTNEAEIADCPAKQQENL